VAVERILRDVRVVPRTILDYGCGDGFTGEHVHAVFGAKELLGFDIELTVEQCVARSHGQIRYANDWAVASPGLFDLGLLCDVIEHVPDDQALLRAVRERLAHEGHLLVTVPAFQALFTGHDRALRHFRRYSLAELESSLATAGFELRGSGYLFASLLPARGLTKLLESLRPPAPSADFGIGAWNGSAALTRALEALLAVDNSLLLRLASYGIKLPGLSAWAVCRTRK
jgi:SAM-dependent methyltransferase